jgi:beta-ribofuranosylaminobenzene 5'-phosphate synthase
VINSPIALAAAEFHSMRAPLVTVRAPGRLHLGFFDPGATLGRRFGSLGLVIDDFETVVQLCAAERDEISGAPGIADGELERAAEHLAALRQRAGRPQPLRLHLARSLPVHAGFGSGTQLALAIGRAFAQVHGIDACTEQIARWLGRGARSGVGIAGFDRGGLLLDGGPGSDGAPAPLLARLELPARWRALLVLDPRVRGLSGPEEKRAIASLPPFSREAAAEVCHHTLMQILPGAASGDFATFAAGLGHVQQQLGEHFAPAQGGCAYTSAAVGRLLQWMARSVGAAVGQSSWGPTGFAILPSAADAEAAVAAARAAALIDPALELHVVQGRNTGATLSVCPPFVSPTCH